MSGPGSLDLDLLFTPSESGYRVQVLDSPAGDGQSGVFDTPFTDLELENFALKVGRSRARTRRVDSSPVAATKDLGGRLFSAVFTGSVRDCLRRSVDQAAGDGAPLRIRLRFSDCPDLANLPWEMLYDRDEDWFIALSNATPVGRYLHVADAPRPLRVGLPLRVLVIRSEPADYPSLDLEAEWAQVVGALGELIEIEAVAITELASPPLSELRRALLRDKFHVVHYMGHGGFDEQNGGVLVFTDHAGNGAPVTAGDLGVLLRDHTSMRLAVLNACEGARSDPADPFAGVADTLIRRGIPAVVAMQFEFSDVAAIEFAPALYGALVAGLPIDAAVGEARKAVYTVSPVEWATPVLHLRAADGHLFDILQGSTGAQIRTPRQPHSDGLVGMAVISVTRPDHVYRDKLSTWKVFIDGEEVGRLRQGQQGDYQVSPGAHELQLKAGTRNSATSPVRTLTLEGGERATFLCASGRSAVTARSILSLRGVKEDLFAAKDTYIALERTGFP